MYMGDLSRPGKPPSYMTDNGSERSKSCSFRGARSGIFSKDSAYRTEGPLRRSYFRVIPGYGTCGVFLNTTRIVI